MQYIRAHKYARVRIPSLAVPIAMCDEITDPMPVMLVPDVPMQKWFDAETFPCHRKILITSPAVLVRTGEIADANLSITRKIFLLKKASKLRDKWVITAPKAIRRDRGLDAQHLAFLRPFLGELLSLFLHSIERQ